MIHCTFLHEGESYLAKLPVLPPVGSTVSIVSGDQEIVGTASLPRFECAWRSETDFEIPVQYARAYDIIIELT